MSLDEEHRKLIAAGDKAMAKLKKSCRRIDRIVDDRRAYAYQRRITFLGIRLPFLWRRNTPWQFYADK